jgi:hypothetical protein
VDEFVRVPREPTEAMIEAGRAAVMARDCSSHQWTARQHYEASGNDENIAATPDGLLDERGKIDKAGGAMLVWYAMVGAAAPSPEPRAVEDKGRPCTNCGEYYFSADSPCRKCGRFDSEPAPQSAPAPLTVTEFVPADRDGPAVDRRSRLIGIDRALERLGK